MNFGFKFGFLGGAGITYPPVSDDLLIWLKGNNSSTGEQKPDSWPEPDRENFTMVNSYAIKCNGVDEIGTTATDHGSIISHSGTADLDYDGTTISTATVDGTICDILFSDGTHFRCADGDGATSFSTDYLTDGYSITWSGSIANMRSGTTDIYHPNTVIGYWTIDGDDTKYPYPVVGFDTFHAGGTFNEAETAYEPESFPVGTFNSLDTSIDIGDCTLSIDDNTIYRGFYDTNSVTDGSYRYIFIGRVISKTKQFFLRQTSSSGTLALRIISSLGTQYDESWGGNTVGAHTCHMYMDGLTVKVEVDGVVVMSALMDSLPASEIEELHIGGYYGGGSVFDGILKNQQFGDILIPINEGTGTDIHDSEGNLVGTLNGNATFWDAPHEVSQELAEAEDAADSYYLTDGSRHPVDKTQQEWISDGVINNDKQRYLTDCNNKPELLVYKVPNSIAEDAEIKVFGCL